MLILELATMVVAIAMAFGATLLTTFDFSDILFFIFATAFVIWFWWGYVMDRLEFPPRSRRFPFLDVLVLILVALIPFALRQREISSVAATLAAVLFAWGLLINGIIRENSETLPEERRRKLRLEGAGRIVVGLILSLCAAIGHLLPTGGYILRGRSMEVMTAPLMPAKNRCLPAGSSRVSSEATSLQQHEPMTG